MENDFDAEDEAAKLRVQALSVVNRWWLPAMTPRDEMMLARELDDLFAGVIQDVRLAGFKVGCEETLNK